MYLVYNSKLVICVELSWTAFLALAGFSHILPEPGVNAQEVPVGLASCQAERLGFPLHGPPCFYRLA